MERKLSKIYTPYNILLFFTTILLIASKVSFSDSIIDEQESSHFISSKYAPLKIVDGDSFEIGTERIRLMGVDAPEYNQSCKNNKKEKYSCGKATLDFLTELISDNEVKCKSHKKDKYNRHLSTCYVNDKDINAELIKNGHAITYLESNYQKEEKFAKRHKLGLWGGKFMHPRLFRKLQEQQKK